MHAMVLNKVGGALEWTELPDREPGPNQIRVQTIHGVVYLRGLVSTPYQIEEAGSIAEQAEGVSSVQNQLMIDNSH